jgi:hypothetical protein
VEGLENLHQRFYSPRNPNSFPAAWKVSKSPPIGQYFYAIPMKFVISVIDDLQSPGTAAEMVEIDKFNDALRANGQWIFAWGLQPPETATVIDNRNDANISTGKPLFDAKENFSGLWIIEAESAEVAERLAYSASKACNRKVELRPMH